MFERRTLPDDLQAVREAYAPECLVLDVAIDFETLPSDAAEDLGLLVESLDPASYPREWLPDDAPRQLHRFASSDFTIGLPGDGTVAWTRQTVPPVVLVKARASGTPEDFLDFLIAEAFVELGQDAPESFLPFFGDQYRELDEAIPLGPADVYQIAAALYDGWLGLGTREAVSAWEGDYPRLYDAWEDAGSRLTGRIDGLPTAVARGETSFSDATELACSAIKHGLELPPPFAALDTAAHREYGASYAVKWATRTFDQLR